MNQIGYKLLINFKMKFWIFIKWSKQDLSIGNYIILFLFISQMVIPSY